MIKKRDTDGYLPFDVRVLGDLDSLKGPNELRQLADSQLLVHESSSSSTVSKKCFKESESSANKESEKKSETPKSSECSRKSVRLSRKSGKFLSLINEVVVNKPVKQKKNIDAPKLISKKVLNDWTKSGMNMETFMAKQILKVNGSGIKYLKNPIKDKNQPNISQPVLNIFSPQKSDRNLNENSAYDTNFNKISRQSPRGSNLTTNNDDAMSKLSDQ